MTPKLAHVGKRFSTFFIVPINLYFRDRMKQPINKYAMEEK
ncbi:hypothetical protein bcere0021_23290 [Bacillus cereus Rock3-42]|nr:hypothetical protein BC059799_2484 [Bacillus cereus NVH0597-99]EEL45561.1 hypothetical protein bcere0021_23290 [Bacillus cereus Rock3-42]